MMASRFHRFEDGRENGASGGGLAGTNWSCLVAGLGAQSYPPEPWTSIFGSNRSFYVIYGYYVGMWFILLRTVRDSFEKLIDLEIWCAYNASIDGGDVAGEGFFRPKI